MEESPFMRARSMKIFLWTMSLLMDLADNPIRLKPGAFDAAIHIGGSHLLRLLMFAQGLF